VAGRNSPEETTIAALFLEQIEIPEVSELPQPKQAASRIQMKHKGSQKHQPRRFSRCRLEIPALSLPASPPIQLPQAPRQLPHIPSHQTEMAEDLQV
jgi:hypothetical protein